jgi:hypothetical protein
MAFLARLIDGQQVVVAASEYVRNLTVIAGAGAVVTVSRVDSHDVATHTAGAHNQFTVAEETLLTMVVDWPFYLVSVVNGDCRVAIV